MTADKLSDFSWHSEKVVGDERNGGLRRLRQSGMHELTGQAQVLEVVAAGAPLKQTLEAIVGLFEEHSPGAFCSVLLLDETGRTLHHGAAPSLPEDYMRQIDGVAIGPQTGSCGTAAYIGQRVIVTDIADDPLWAAYRHLVLGYGLRACWSVPIFSPARKVLGTFAVYYRETRKPEPGELSLIESLAHLASLAIERARSEQKLQASEARFRALTERSGEGISLLSLDGTISYTSPVMETILGYNIEEVVGRPAADRVHPDDLSPLRQLLEPLSRQPGKSEIAVYRSKHKNGSWRWIESVFTNLMEEPSVRAIVINFRDITERKNAADALRQSEALYRSLVSSLDEGVVLQDTNAVILAMNAGAQRILGLTEAQMRGRDSFDPRWRAIHEDGLPFPGESHPAVRTLRTGQPCSNEVMGIHLPNGELRWISINSQPLFHEGETKPAGVVSSFADITNRKAIEDALRASEERFAKAFNASPVPMVIFELVNRRIVNVNEALISVSGWTAEEMIGRDSNELGFWADKEQQEMVRELVDTQGSVRDLEIKLCTKAGEVREFLYSAEVMMLEKRPHLLVIVNDITERLRTARALRESEERYRLLFEHGFAGISRSSLDGRILECNEALAKIFGCESREELLRHYATDFYFDPAERQHLIEDLKRHGKLRNYERLVKRKDGSPIWTLANFSLHRRGQDGELYWDSIILDITQRKQVEQRLAESHEQMRALSARLESIREEERTRISREIHDNLGQVLTGLKLEFSWLEKNLSRASDETLRRKAMPKLKEISQLLEETIQTVRYIATELRPGVLDTLGLSAALDWQAREFARRGGLRCETRLCQEPPELPPERATALFRVFQEILTNIARHARARQFTVEMTETQGELLLTVRDNGIGITQAQLQSPTSLGLIGMRERVLIFGGSVLIEGASGTAAKGTLVQVKMPVTR